MQTYVALLRGINVSGQNAIRMPELRLLCARLGLEDARTYLHSGNVVFRAARSNARTLAGAIKAGIAQDFGHAVAVLVLARQELDSVANANPLRARADADEKLFHATFLFDAVSPADFAALQLPAAAGEAARLLGRAVLLYCPHGYGTTKLNNAYFETALGVTATTRNWRTVRALQQLCAAP